MNLRLVRNDAAFRATPAWALLAGLNAGVVSGLLVTAALGRAASPSAGTIALAIWLSVGVYLVAGPVTTRATEHELALPISGRRLWLHHALAVLIGCLAIVAVGAVLLGLLAAVAALRGPARLSVAAPTALAAAASLLAVALIEAAARGEAALAGRWRHRAWRIAVVLAIAVAVVFAGRAPWAAALGLFALAAVCGVLAVRGVPPALDLVPRAAVAAPRRDARRAMDATADRTAMRWRARLAPLLFRWLPLFSRYGWLVFAVLLGFLAAGGQAALSDDPDLGGLRLFYLYLVSYMLISTNGPLLRPLRFVDPLPLPRGRVLAALFLPPVVGIAAGALVGAAFSTLPFGVLMLELALVVTLWLLALAALLAAYRPGVPDCGPARAVLGPARPPSRDPDAKPVPRDEPAHAPVRHRSRPGDGRSRTDEVTRRRAHPLGVRGGAGRVRRVAGAPRVPPDGDPGALGALRAGGVGDGGPLRRAPRGEAAARGRRRP